VITWASEEQREHEEGCLSIPDIYAMITRPEAVRVRFLDRDGIEQEREFAGIQATCVQHEIDHLNGKLFIDYLSAMRRQMITGKMKKFKRERARTRAAAE
jgi:peptide deformylase